MVPEQFLAKLSKQPLAPAYLFLGQEGYQRRVCKDALLERVLPAPSRTEGLTAIDLSETSLSNVLDDARSMSLFATDRVVWVSSAEFALPRRLAANDEQDGADNSPERRSDRLLEIPYTRHGVGLRVQPI